MNTIEKFQDLKRLIAEKQREADKSAGALDEILKQLNKEYDCKTLKQARELLAKMKEREQKALKKFELRLKKFQKKYDLVLAQ